tara:strand:+ start:403 stop:696 length:294 start_codon:yes stop_codon:yes gene_type:complete
MENLKKALVEAIGYIKLTDYLWVGVIKNEKARKYKYQVFWFYGDDHYDYEDSSKDQLKHAESRMCETVKEAYAYGFDAIKNTQEKNPAVRISITDLI